MKEKKKTNTTKKESLFKTVLIAVQSTKVIPTELETRYLFLSVTVTLVS